MAEANAAVAPDGDEKKLYDIFLSGWNLIDELETTELPFNGTEFQNKVKTAMGHFEQATVIVNQVSMFSSNELIDEVSTDSLPFMLLPYFLGKLTTKIHNQHNTEALELGEVYFKDHLKRCHEYELYDGPMNKAEQDNKTDAAQQKSELQELKEAASNRNEKIAQFRKMKEIDEYMSRMRNIVKNKSADDEVRREFFLKYLQKSIIEAKQELDNLHMMKEMLKMRLAHKKADEDMQFSNMQGFDRGNGHSHGHHSHHHGESKPKPLQPFIITRNAAQKAVFGLGYPSLPIMSVDEFYQQRVDEGIFPDEQKMAKINQEKAIAAALDPNEQEDEEKAVVELQVEDDDPEYLARMRRMDEYKDVVRRGDGNRHNRS
ncbi:immunoglobulin-binding protein 1 [Drosophila grimshawi]|uniref:GH13460 n=1 Tax=Drosophila grimshawi TaxID=7222 RepID=B4JP72_DROGR|nr:immunoglobulin-binding protein 1 [Drosophila grimshawi]EDV98702.1 GH13460 [Drosophila grimshawi]